MISFDVAHAGGTAWLCGPDCGVIQLGGRPSERRWSFEVDERTRPSGHHGWYHVGELTASLPAVGDHEMPDEAELGAAARLRDAAREKPQAETQRETVATDAPAVGQLQGRWQSYYDGVRSWWIEFDGRSFYAEMSPDDWYRGEIFVRPDAEPAEIDLLIQDCRCGYKGASSHGIYRWEGLSLRLDAPSPGDPRPSRFGQRQGESVKLVRVGKKAGN